MPAADHFISASYASGRKKSELAIKRSAHKIMIEESFMALKRKLGGEKMRLCKTDAVLLEETMALIQEQRKRPQSPRVQ